ncbi:MAG: hypothetical protein ACOYMN_14695 [Roseimicrobium sp.]
MKKTTLTLLTALLLVPLGTLHAADPFKDAVTVWHFAGTDGLEAIGAAKTQVKLEGADRAASLARGGDGMVAEMDGGYFVASGDAKVTGKQMTLLLRLRDRRGTWDSPLLARRDASDPLANLLYCVDGRQKPRDYYEIIKGKERRFGATHSIICFMKRAMTGRSADPPPFWNIGGAPSPSPRSPAEANSILARLANKRPGRISRCARLWPWWGWMPGTMS